MNLLLLENEISTLKKLLDHFLGRDYYNPLITSEFTGKLFSMREFLKEPVTILVMRIDTDDLIILAVLTRGYQGEARTRRLGEGVFDELLQFSLFLYSYLCDPPSKTLVMSDYYGHPVTYPLRVPATRKTDVSGEPIFSNLN